MAKIKKKKIEKASEKFYFVLLRWKEIKTKKIDLGLVLLT